MVAIEEIRQQATVQIAKVEEAAQAKYDSAMNNFQRELTAKVDEIEMAALEKYNVAVENVQREAGDRVAQAEEKVTKATHRAEAAALSAAETHKQVQALVKQLLDANALAEVSKKVAADATLRAERAEEQVKQMEGLLETTRTGMGRKLFEWPIQEDEDRDWAMGETMEREQRMDLGPSRAVSSKVPTGQLPQAMQRITLESVQSHGTPKNGTIDPSKPVSSNVLMNVELQSSDTDTDMVASDLDIYSPEDSSHTQKPYGAPSETKRATSIVRSSGGKGAEENRKGRPVEVRPWQLILHTNVEQMFRTWKIMTREWVAAPTIPATRLDA